MRYIIIIVLLFSYSFANAQKDTIRPIKKEDFAGPVPVAKIAGKTGNTTISMAELIAAEEIVVGTEYSDVEEGYKVVEFNLAVKIGGFEKMESSSGSKLTAKQKELLKQVKPGDNVYIEKIKVKGPDGKYRNFSPINLKVSN